MKNLVHIVDGRCNAGTAAAIGVLDGKRTMMHIVAESHPNERDRHGLTDRAARRV